jgi:2-hydroxychromene-2-carboxylate isomerase
VGAARVAACFAGAAWLPDFVRAVYRANFGDDRDISDAGVVRECLASAGADADEVMAVVSTPEGKARLRSNTETAQRLGIFGAPTFRVGDELFWGHDRLDEALDWARQGSTA